MTFNFNHTFANKCIIQCRHSKYPHVDNNSLTETSKSVWYVPAFLFSIHISHVLKPHTVAVDLNLFPLHITLINDIEGCVIFVYTEDLNLEAVIRPDLCWNHTLEPLSSGVLSSTSSSTVHFVLYMDHSSYTRSATYIPSYNIVLYSCNTTWCWLTFASSVIIIIIASDHCK